MPKPLGGNIASATATATGQSSGVLLGNSEERLSVLINVTAVSGTTPSSTFSIQWSNDGSAWADGDPADAFTAITAVGTKVKTFQVQGEYFRLKWTISGTTPSFTFTATGVTTGAGLA